jgi:hypothetical protein
MRKRFESVMRRKLKVQDVWEKDEKRKGRKGRKKKVSGNEDNEDSSTDYFDIDDVSSDDEERARGAISFSKILDDDLKKPFDEDDDEQESSDEERDKMRMFVHRIEAKSWLDQPDWVREDFGEGKGDFATDDPKEGRSRVALSLLPRDQTLRGYRLTKEMAVKDPWTFGITLLKPIKQETVPLIFHNFRFAIPSSMDEAVRTQLNIQRMLE